MAAKQVRNVALSMAAPFSREKQKPAAKALILRKRPFDRDQHGNAASMGVLQKRETSMSTNEMAFLVFAVSAFAVFGGVLAWACWMEWRENKHAR